MPFNYSYPGVYVEEVPSGVRTITGVSTSITAFIGRAFRGEVNEPILITSYNDFERTFGGLHVDYPMSYAVKDFFLNGGSQALIVRLYKPDEDGKSALDYCSVLDPDKIDVNGAEGTGDSQSPGETSGPDSDTLTEVVDAEEVEPGSHEDGGGTQPAEDGTGFLDVPPGSGVPDGKETLKKLRAANPGTWGNRLSLKIDYEGLSSNDDIKQVLGRYGLDKDLIKLEIDFYFFNLTVVENPHYGPREIFRNITLHPDGGSRRIDRVLKQGSSLVQWGEIENTYSVEAEIAVRPPTTTSHQDPTQPDTKPVLFENGGDSAHLTVSEDFIGEKDPKTGMYALEKADLYNLLCIPPDLRNGETLPEVYQEAMKYCVDRRAMLIVDPPTTWKKANGTMPSLSDLTALGLTGPVARNAAIYFPRVIQSDPLRENQLDTFVPCGIMAGLMAQTDSLRGVWKAPAGTDAALQGVKSLEVNLNDAENGQLNPLGINCLRSFPLYGHVSWGARTLRGADQMADEYKYIPVRRLALYIEESLYRGLKWVVFEPNDEPLWRQIWTNVKVFMDDLFKLGAFQGNSPDEAYLVKCDSETTTQSDINKGIVNILVGFAPLKPAEFVVIKIQQLAGQLIGA